VREFRTPGSVRGALGNRRPYRDLHPLMLNRQDAKIAKKRFYWGKTVFPNKRFAFFAPSRFTLFFYSNACRNFASCDS